MTQSPESVLQNLLSDQAAQMLGTALYPKAVGKLFSALPVPPSIAHDLYNVPCEVSVEERTLLFNFFRYVWTGKNSVVEIGPLFGGSTRAIALGMMHNAARSPEARYLVYDRFIAYYDKTKFFERLAPLFQQGILGAADREAVERGPELPEFHEIFRKIHSNMSYSSILSTHKARLPDTPRHIAQIGDQIVSIPQGTKLDIAFIDGCKSWFATKYFMKQVVACTQPGAFHCFQDFAWYSCFWIPSFVMAFHDCFRLTGFCMTTYIFQQVKPITEAMIDERFPDTPEQVGIAKLDEQFSHLLEIARQTNDVFGMVFFTLQRASALAYCGDRDRAKTMIIDLSKVPCSPPYQQQIGNALIAPTYRPAEYNEDPAIRVTL